MLFTGSMKTDNEGDTHDTSGFNLQCRLDIPQVHRKKYVSMPI